jgi:acyl carrier protein
LGEIEAVLRQAPGVEQCVVVVHADQSGDRRLVAYVVAETGAANEWRLLLQAKLPEYMVPQAFMCLDALPLTVNGKVDRRALPAPVWESGGEQYVAPRTATEELLAGIWGEVLQRERVGVEENFFEAGGHSLLATQVISRVRSVFQVELPLRALFEAPTIASLAQRIETAPKVEQSTGAIAAPPIMRASRQAYRVSA